MTWLAFLVAVAYVPGLPSATLVGRWWVAAIGAAILLLRTPRLRPTLAHWIGLAFIAWCAAGLIWTYSEWDTLGGLIHLLTLAGVFCVVAAAAAAEGEGSLSAATAMAAFGLGLVPSAVVAVGQQFGWQPVLNISDHPVGLFLSKNGATEAAVPMLVWFIVSRGGGAFVRRDESAVPSNATWPRSAMLLVGAAALMLTALAQAKEAWLMLTAAALVVALHWARERDRTSYPLSHVRTTGVLAAAVGLTALALVVVATWPESSTASLNERLAIWQATLDAWALRPWGWGLGTYQWLLFDFEYAHDDFLQLLFETGPLGLALVVAFIAAVLVPRGHDLASKAALASLLASALVWWPLQSPASGFLVALLAGGLAGARARGRELEPAGRMAGGAGVRHWGIPRREGTVRVVPVSWDHMAY